MYRRGARRALDVREVRALGVAVGPAARPITAPPPPATRRNRYFVNVSNSTELTVPSTERAATRRAT